VAKDRTASVRLCQYGSAEHELLALTNCSDNLCFDAELVGKSSCEVRDTPSSISGDVWNLSDMIVHVSASEHQDQDQAQYCPYVSVLENGKDVWICHSAEGKETNHNGHSSDQLRPVEGSSQGRVTAGWEMPLYPCMNILG